MDISLDDYITKKGGSNKGRFGPKPGAKSDMKGRLGARSKGPLVTIKNKVKGVQQQQSSVKQRLGNQKDTQFIVKGLSKMQAGFDARQKIAARNNSGPVKDARDKIVQKTKFGDARAKIESKKAKAEPVDARAKIKAKQAQTSQSSQAKKTQQTSSSSGDFMVIKTQGPGGQEVRMINSAQQGVADHKITVGSNSIFVTAANKAGSNVPSSRQQSGGNSSSGKLNIPRIQVRNDKYHPPTPPVMEYEDEEEEEEHQPYIPIISFSDSPPRPSPVSKPVSRPVSRPVARPVTTPLARPVKKAPAIPAVRTVPKAVDESPTADVISPLQGFKVLVTNLHPVVTMDDIVELFAAVGALKKCRMIKAGTAEVIFFKKEEALQAIKRYHNRELDGIPMQVKMMTSLTAKVAKPPEESEEGGAQPRVFGRLGPAAGKAPLKLSSTSSAKEGGVDVSLIHRALFKTKDPTTPTPTKPVTFTVKI